MTEENATGTACWTSQARPVGAAVHDPGLGLLGLGAEAIRECPPQQQLILVRGKAKSGGVRARGQVAGGKSR